ncbi:type II restriction endonuclease [Candidatus Obscuribacterales bacterium]|jgi:type II restriction enzyme|nr:type II restriction endonuclease [Candidatus Obscuribacterales bacterium]
MTPTNTVDFDATLLVNLIEQYKSDPESVYNTWFAGSEERLKAFRAIRVGVRDTFTAIAAGTFGNDFKGSPLEVVLTAITEQKQVFQGAAHAFYWKPKMRIPDIYETPENKRKFGEFLESCYSASREDQILDQMSRLAAAEIKGLGPAVANIVYFLHPTLVLPFNTAIVNGFNALFSDKIKLGSWQSYFAMREACIRVNSHGEIRNQLSKDLGAIAGLLFEIGSGRLLVDGNISTVLANEKEKAQKVSKARHQEVVQEQNEESEHTRIQYLLVKIGRALKFDVFVARNDRHKICDGQSLAQLTIPDLPAAYVTSDAADGIPLIDVLWLRPDTAKIVSAFEVEKSTSIYSGILRMEDLARSMPQCQCALYLVAPDSREKEVLAQLRRPSFRKALADVSLSYIPFSELVKHYEALMKFGEDHTIMRKISRHCTCEID